MKVKRQHIRCLPTSYSTRQCKSFFFFCSKPPAPLFGGNRDWCFSSEARNRIFIDDAVVCSDSWLIQNGSELHTKCSLGLMPRCIRWHKTMFASHRRNGCDQQHIYRFCCFFFFFLFSIIFIIIFRFLIIIFVRCCKPPLPSPTPLPLSWIFILSAKVTFSVRWLVVPCKIYYTHECEGKTQKWLPFATRVTLRRSAECAADFTRFHLLF